MQPQDPRFAASPQAHVPQHAPPPKKSGGAGVALLVAGGCGCLGLLGAVGVIGLAFFLAARGEQAFQGGDPYAYADDPYGYGGDPYAYGGGPPIVPGGLGAQPAPDPYGGLAAAAPAVFAVPVDGSPQLGPDDALVTIVAFSDFQCPFCARVTATLEQVRAQYGDDVRIVFKHNPLPFHQRAMPAAQASMAVFEASGADAFWRMHDLTFAGQRTLEDADLERYARQAGASATAVRDALRRDAHRDVIQRDMDLAQRVGATGTPTFFINGKPLQGAQPFSTFADTIELELALARLRVAAGTPRARVYSEILAEASR